MRKAEVRMHNLVAGYLWQDEEGYHFAYEQAYLQTQSVEPVSVTLPLQEEAFRSIMIFPFFDGLIPEGWLLDIAEAAYKLNPRDRMGLLLACCKDCIGAASIYPVMEGEEA